MKRESKKRMTVYVVAPYYGWGGMGVPVAVYAREAHAKAHKEPGELMEVTELVVSWSSPTPKRSKRRG